MWDYRARPLEVLDGDTIRLEADLGYYARHRVDIRLLDVHAPELREPGGPETGAFVQEWLEQLAAIEWPLAIHTQITRVTEPTDECRSPATSATSATSCRCAGSTPTSASTSTPIPTGDPGTERMPCAICHPIVDGDHRLGEHHLGVRFDDEPFLVLLNGVEVQNWVDEAWAGPDGWVRIFDRDDNGKIVLCGNDHARTSIRRGEVQVRSWRGHVN
jgi:hypothetical protein